MKLQILSDLHLSFSGMDVPQADADVVVLAGDIARPEDAVAWASAFARPVLYVPGNHEFYGGSIDRTLQELRRLCADAGIHFLDGDALVIGGTRFLGATLWTDFVSFDEASQGELPVQAALRFVRDFARIRTSAASEALFAPADSMRLFERYAAWLEQQLQEPFAGPTVVITHHAPSRRSISRRFAGSPINACFVSDLERLMGRDRVALWIHGHTHDSFDYVVNGTRVVCNPRGYARDGINENRAFDPKLVVELQQEMSA